MQLKQRKINYNVLNDETKEIFLYEINNHLLMDEKPSEYFNSILDVPILRKHPFCMLYNLKTAEQSPVHHPEGNAWKHTMLVIDYAAKEKHRSKNEKVGAAMAREFLEEFTTDERFIEKVCSLIRWHMQILHVVKDMPFGNIKAMKEETDVNEVALLGYCDRMGRKNPDVEREKQNIAVFLKKCRDYKE